MRHNVNKLVFVSLAKLSFITEISAKNPEEQREIIFSPAEFSSGMR